MTAICVFRYGQGTDYFNYERIYNASMDLNSWVFEKDLGFAYLSHLFAVNNISYQYFSATVGLISMTITYPFFSKICNKRIFPLLIFYAFIFLIYPMSGIRQGLSIAILLGVMIPLLLRKKYIFFYIALAIGSTIHLSLLITALLPFLININIDKNKLYFAVVISTIILIFNVNFSSIIDIFGGRTDIYFENANSPSFIPKLLRFIIIILILSIPDFLIRRPGLRVRNILVFGYFVYSILSFSDTLAGRFETYFRVFEMLFISIFIYNSIKYKYVQIYSLSFFLIYTTLWVKNIQSQIVQGDYKRTSVFSYPFISIFNQKEIAKFRSDNSYSKEIN